MSHTIIESQLKTSIVGFGRMGPQRELKKLTETFWKEACPIGTPESQVAIQAFEKDVEALQIARWKELHQTGVSLVPSGDFSLYDQVLDIAFCFNAIPSRYLNLEPEGRTIRTYFAMARGHQEASVDVPALPMKKWFDTNCTWRFFC